MAAVSLCFTDKVFLLEHLEKHGSAHCKLLIFLGPFCRDRVYAMKEIPTFVGISTHESRLDFVVPGPYSASTVSFRPTALVTAARVESRGLPRADKARYRLSR